ncbi:hypothetical protein [Piscinibacter sp.]|nr:hypothetical protein [Albitalea sp.]
MLHDEQGHAAVGRQSGEQLGERFEASGGSADADHRKDPRIGMRIASFIH